MYKLLTSIMMVLTIIVLPSLSLEAQKKKASKNKGEDYPLQSSQLSALRFRSIGPAMISGRIIDLAVNPQKHSEYFVAAASGHVWKTTDGGVTFKPVFDHQGPYSIGCVTLAPSNPHCVWVGTGENNSQRSVSRGMGVYKSLDGGKTWKNMGLKASEHIGKILVHPTNENVVYVAAQGPLWNAGGDRGLYKSIDGGKTWDKVLDISSNTGVSDLVMDPRNPEVLYAVAYQRRRHVFTLINGGPESALYKSTDGGHSWRKLTRGLPTGDLGRIGLAISPVNPDKLYAVVEASEDKGGMFRSFDRGESWQKVNSRVSTSPQYYNELFADPKEEDMIYTMDTWSAWSPDGGKTWHHFSTQAKHVDDHVLWVDPDDTQHLLMGCDGGLYESFNHGSTWDFKQNLPLSQFYRVTVDNDYPFYHVYGGTQDNNSVYGPSRTISASGIVNSDWKITHGGDGFETVIDPDDPTTVYAQSQYGWLVRYNRTTHEELDIKPIEPEGEAYRWNWNAPVVISHFDHKTLYFAANKLFKSDDRGNSWKVISPDLSRQIDRNKLRVMGKVQSPEAVAKNASTSLYGNVVALAESPKKQGLLFAGSDDGKLSVTSDDGQSWKHYTSFAGVPDMSYISAIVASNFDEQVVYMALDNHKRGDYKPYILKSSDRGESWISISGNLPEDQTVYALIQDHRDPQLLFAGTEYGLFFTVDEGQHWVQLKSGLPSIAIRDIDIQRRDDALVLASYGRGFYILDNYDPLRHIKKIWDEKQSTILPVKDAFMFKPSHDWGWRKKGHQGDNFFTADNPPVAVAINYYFAEELKSLRTLRKEKEKKAAAEKVDIEYPSFEELAREDRELQPWLVFVIRDARGQVVRKLKAPASKGLHTIEWDMRYAGTRPLAPGRGKYSFANEGGGMPAMPGKYTVEMQKVVHGHTFDLGSKQSFTLKNLYSLQASEEDMAFYFQLADLIKKFYAMTSELQYLNKKVDLMILAFKAGTGTQAADLAKAYALKRQLDSVQIILNGDPTHQKRNASFSPGLTSRINLISWSVWSSSEGPTQTHRDNYALVYRRGKVLSEYLDTLSKTEIKALEKALDDAGAPYTPGRKIDF